MGADLRIGPPRLERRATGCRVSARVGTADVWFESEDVSLAPSAEGFASAFVIPALASGRQLVIAAPVAEDWAANVPALTALVCGWWGYPRMLPELSVAAASPGRPESSGVGLCFSGGVDSFYSLFHRVPRAELLVLVHGFDIPLDDTARATSARGMLDEVADATGTRAVEIRTNIREHPDFRRENWERTHGAAAAAIGHLLSASLKRLVISSSYPAVLQRPWGSHWDLDPLWSGAGLVVEHFGESFSRGDKLRRLIGNPLAQRRLRVCWERRDDRVNCSRCGKCVRTRLLLCAAGGLDLFPVLDDTSTLARDIDALPPVGHRMSTPIYQWALAQGLPADVNAALLRLLIRNRRQERRARLQFITKLPGSILGRIAGPLQPSRRSHPRPEEGNAPSD